MPRQHPDPRMSVPISLEVYYQLLGGPHSPGFDKEYWENAAEAIDEWARRHDPESISMAAFKGYQWKGLFLPDGTVLRTVFGGKNHHCLVERDHILYNGKSVSPSGFVNAVGGVRRNAWRCTWILLPDAKHWQLADTLRSPATSRRTRQPKTAPAIEPTVDRSPVAALPEASALPAPTPRSTEDAAAVHDRPDATPGQVARNGAIVDRRKLQHAVGAVNLAQPCICARGQYSDADCGTRASLREALVQLIEHIGAATPPLAPAHARMPCRPTQLRPSRVWRRALQARSRSGRTGR